MNINKTFHALLIRSWIKYVCVAMELMQLWKASMPFISHLSSSNTLPTKRTRVHSLNWNQNNPNLLNDTRNIKRNNYGAKTVREIILVEEKCWTSFQLKTTSIFSMKIALTCSHSTRFVPSILKYQIIWFSINEEFSFYFIDKTIRLIFFDQSQFRNIFVTHTRIEIILSHCDFSSFLFSIHNTDLK